jgi:hypothetical protein
VAVRRRSSSSSTLSRWQLEGGARTPGTAGCSGARPAPVGSNRRATSEEIMSRRFLVLVGIFSGKRGGLFIGGRGRARGWPEVGAGAVSVEDAVAGRVGEAWAASAGVGVMSVACWLGVVMEGG